MFFSCLVPVPVVLPAPLFPPFFFLLEEELFVHRSLSLFVFPVSLSALVPVISAFPGEFYLPLLEAPMVCRSVPGCPTPMLLTRLLTGLALQWYVSGGGRR